MGKKSNKRMQKDRYDRKDYSHLIPKADTDQKPEKRERFTKRPAENPMDAQRKETAANFVYHFSEQVLQYIDHVDHGDTATDNLFVMGELNATNYPDYRFYVLTRSVRMDRDIHLLVHGEFHAVVIDNQTNAPAYYINALIWKNLTASILVTPIGENGPEYHNRARWTNRKPKTEAEAAE